MDENLAMKKALADAFKQQSPVFFSTDKIDITFQTNILKIADDNIVLENTVPPKHITNVAHSENFYIQTLMVQYHSNRIKTDGQNIIFPLKNMEVMRETRESKRVDFTKEENVTCELLNPFDKETIHTKNVMDMSATGLSIVTQFQSKLFEPGTFFPELRILIDEQPYSKTSGTVVYTKKIIDDLGKLKTQVGIKFNNSLGAPPGSN